MTLTADPPLITLPGAIPGMGGALAPRAMCCGLPRRSLRSGDSDIPEVEWTIGLGGISAHRRETSSARLCL